MIILSVYRLQKECVHALVDHLKTTDALYTSMNWQNQTYFEDLGRGLTESEFL